MHCSWKTTRFMKFYLKEFEYKAQLEVFKKFNKPFWTLYTQINGEKYYFLQSYWEDYKSCTNNNNYFWLYKHKAIHET